MCKARSMLGSTFGAEAPGVRGRLEEYSPAQMGISTHHCPQTPGSRWSSWGSTGKISVMGPFPIRCWNTPHPCSSEAGLIDWSHMNLKAIKSREDEKQFKLLYYHFLVKYQFSPQPYCEAAGSQISTVLACAPGREECLVWKAETSALISSGPVTGTIGGGGPLQVVSLQARDGKALPTGEFQAVGRALSCSFF